MIRYFTAEIIANATDHFCSAAHCILDHFEENLSFLRWMVRPHLQHSHSLAYCLQSVVEVMRYSGSYVTNGLMALDIGETLAQARQFTNVAHDDKRTFDPL